MSTILKFEFQKRKQLRFFRSKLSKLHKNDPHLHVANRFSLKKREPKQAMDPFHTPSTCKRVFQIKCSLFKKQNNNNNNKTKQNKTKTNKQKQKQKTP